MRPLLLVALVVSAPTHARAAAKEFDVAASLGYAFPVGSTEKGARLGDGTFGIVPIEISAMYHLDAPIAVGLWGRYGFGIPTLCASGSECVSSLGSDVAIAARVRVFLPTFLTADPYADLGVGYEWYTSRLADGAVTSAHGYDGPLLLSTELGAPFRLGSTWAIGPEIGFSLGTFAHSHIDAPGVSRDLGVPDRSIHGWLAASARLSARF